MLTPKQKQEQRMAELRKQALLASGVQIEGLQQQGQAPKRPVYDNKKKKKGPASQQAGSGPSTREPSPVREEKPATPEPIPAPEPEKETEQEQEEKAEDVKSDWDASSDDEKPDVKDSWDADSDEEEAKPSAPAKATSAGNSLRHCVPIYY